MSNSLTDIFNQLTGVLKQDAITWLFQEYAALQAMPQKLATQRQGITMVLADVPASDATNLNAMAQASSANTNLSWQYPTMIGAVNAAYQSAQQLTATGVSSATATNAAGIAQTIYTAQQFMQGVSDVDATIKGVIDALLSSGAISPTEAGRLYAQAQAANSGWLQYVLYAAIAYVAFRLVRKVL